MRKIIVIIFFVFSFAVAALGQPTNSPPSNGPGDPGGDPDEVPITGIEILIAAGGLFGAKKIYDKRKGK